MMMTRSFVVRVLTLGIAFILVTGCNQQVQTAPSQPAEQPTPTATTPSRQVSPVVVRIGDADNRRPSSGGLIRSVDNVGAEYTYLAWGDEVWINVIVAGDRVIADDLRQRITATPGADYTVQIVEQTDDRQFRITFHPSEVGDTEFRIAARPTMDKAPVFAQDLHYTISKVDEPTFDIRCAEHPEIRYGSSLAVAPGIKHFTMTFTQPVPRDEATATLTARYQAKEITWANDLRVDFIVEMKPGDKLTLTAPTIANLRGLPFAHPYLPPEIWTVEPRKTSIVSKPGASHSVATLTTLTVGVALSPGGEYAVIAEETPIFYDLWRYGSVSLVDLKSGKRVPLVDNMVFRGLPTQGVLWHPDGKRFWLVDRVGHSAVKSEPDPAAVARLVDLDGNSRAIPLGLGDGQSVRGAAVSPIDGSLVVGVVRYEGANSNHYPYALRAYSPDGAFVGEYPAGWLQSQNPTLRSDLSYSSDGKAVYLEGGLFADAQGALQKGIVKLDLVTGSTSLMPSPFEINSVSASGMYLAAVDQYATTYTVGVFRADGQKVADLKGFRSYVWSPDGTQFAYLDESGHLIVYDPPTKESSRWLDRPAKSILSWTREGILISE